MPVDARLPSSPRPFFDELRNGSQKQKLGPSGVACLWASKCRIPDEFHRAGT